MPIRSVLFDLDGVLLDTEGIYTDFWNEMDRYYPTRVVGFAHKIKGSTLPTILSTYFPDTTIQAKIREHLVRHEHEMVYRPFDGALELLAKLKENGITTAIVTSSNSLKMAHIFDVLPQLKELIDVVITDEHVKASKPNPEGYLLAAKRLNATVGEFIVVEDSLAGIEAGRRAEAFVVGVATTNPRNIIEPIADMTIDSIEQLSIDIISKLS